MWEEKTYNRLEGVKEHEKGFPKTPCDDNHERDDEQRNLLTRDD